MSKSENQINEQLAKQLLKSLYKLDGPIGRLDALISDCDDKKVKDILTEIVSDILWISLNELMVPIYACQPGLGRASQPGPWITES